MNTVKMLEICYECGVGVKAGSGNFVNRVPCGDSYEENVEAGRPYPRGEWLCGSCDEKIFDDDEDCLHNYDDNQSEEGICQTCGHVNS